MEIGKALAYRFTNDFKLLINIVIAIVIIEWWPRLLKKKHLNWFILADKTPNVFFWIVIKGNRKSFATTKTGPQSCEIQTNRLHLKKLYFSRFWSVDSYMISWFHRDLQGRFHPKYHQEFPDNPFSTLLWNANWIKKND